MGARWPPCPYMVKPFKIFSKTSKPNTFALGIQHQGLGPYKLCSNDDTGLTLTYLTARSTLLPMDFANRNSGELLVPGSIITNEGSKPKLLSRIAKSTAVLSSLKIIWRDKNISLTSKVKLMWKAILSTFLYACESLILRAELERGTQSLIGDFLTFPTTTI